METEVIPAVVLPTTGQLPVVREPRWDELVPRTRRRPARARTRRGDMTMWVAEKTALTFGWGALAVYMIEYVFQVPVV